MRGVRIERRCDSDLPVNGGSDSSGELFDSTALEPWLVVSGRGSAVGLDVEASGLDAAELEAPSAWLGERSGSLALSTALDSQAAKRSALARAVARRHVSSLAPRLLGAE